MISGSYMLINAPMNRANRYSVSSMIRVAIASEPWCAYSDFVSVTEVEPPASWKRANTAGPLR